MLLSLLLLAVTDTALMTDKNTNLCIATQRFRRQFDHIHLKCFIFNIRLPWCQNFWTFFSNKLNMTTSLSILIQTQGRDQNMVGASHSIDLSLTLAHDRWRGLWSYCIKKLLPEKYTSWPGLRAKLVNYKGTGKRKSGSLCGPEIWGAQLLFGSPFVFCKAFNKRRASYLWIELFAFGVPSHWSYFELCKPFGNRAGFILVLQVMGLSCQMPWFWVTEG